ncbi:MAG: hypothetical protein M3314_00225, partial [Actinomycetota bacterium]|nr:hypothetical protein [Actinomycetota bacterium]
GAGLVTFAAYLPGLGRSLDFDSAETVGLFVRPGPPWAAFERQAVFNNHPLFSFLEQLVRVGTGRTDAAAMRVLPILFGAVTVAVLTWFACRRLGLLSGIVAGAVVAANPTFAGLSRSVRGYSLLALCAVVSTVLVLSDDGRRSRRSGGAYLLVAAAGVATHLYMVPVLAGHAGVLLARRAFDQRWRARFLAVLLLSALAYAGMASTLVDAASAHSRVFQADFPGRVARMATGGAKAWLLLAPLAAVGAAVTLRRSPAAGGGGLTLAVVLVGLWAVLQSSALGERFFVWLVPAAAYMIAVAVRRFPTGAVVAGVGVVLAVVGMVPGYTRETTSYRQAAELIRRASADGATSCVVGVGVPPMLAYLDAPADFSPVTRPEELAGCEVVVVAAWWADSTAAWFAADKAVIAAAEDRYPHRLVLPAEDPGLVLSARPVS